MKKKIEELLRYGVQRLQISIDGATPNTQEYLRGNNTYHIIHNLIKAFPNFITPMYTIHAKNIDEIQPFIDQEKSLGVTKIGFERYIPTQNNPYNKELELTKEQLLFAYETISQNVGIDFHINDPLFNTFLLMKNNVTSDVVIKSFVDTGCQAYENNIYIDAKGNLYPCIFSEEPLFNVHNKKITTYKTFKPPIIKGCAGCIYYCICKGCRAAAAYYYKDWLERDPLCPIY